LSDQAEQAGVDIYLCTYIYRIWREWGYGAFASVWCQAHTHG